MSGLIISKNPLHSLLVHEALKKLCFVKWARIFEAQAGSFNFGTSWIGPTEYIPYLCHPELKITIIMLGKLYAPEGGTIINKIFDKIIESYQAKGPNVLCNFSGAGALILIDHLKDRCFVVTDRMGFFPLYVASPQSEVNTIICSHPDVLAACYSQQLRLDEVSLAEFLYSGICTHPHTFYKDIKQLNPGTVYSWDDAGFRKTTEYWRPEIKLDPNKSEEYLAHELAEAIKNAVNIRLKNVKGKVGLFLSGGLDSRALLFSAEDAANKFVAITLCDEINREVRTARELAHLASIEHVILKRDFEYYGKQAIDAVRVSGGFGDFQDAHFLGFTNHINNLNINLFLTGWSMDFLFKGLALDTRWKRALPFLLNKRILSDFSYNWPLPFYQVKNKNLTLKIKERVLKKYNELPTHRLSIEDWMKIEQRRIFPISQTRGFSQIVISYRTLPFDIPNADNHILHMFEIIPSAMKLNDKIFLKTLAKISNLCTSVLNANTGLPVFASSSERIRHSIKARFERFRNRFGNVEKERTIITDGSWINWEYYIKNSRVMKILLQDIRQRSGNYINNILGYDIFLEPLDILAKNDRLVTRIITLGIWLNYKIK